MCSKVAGWLCLLLVLLTVQQVVARYVFSASSVALQELQWHLFGAVFLLGIAEAWKKDIHVRVDFLTARLPKRKKLLIEIFGTVLMLVPLSILICWYGYTFALSALEFKNPHPLDYWSASFKGSSVYEMLAWLEGALRKTLLTGEISPDPGGLEARWIIKMLIPFSFLLLTLQAVVKLCQNIQSLRGKEQ